MADEELKLTVSLVDNATPQLRSIKGALADLGSSGAHNALRESHKHTKNLNDVIGTLGHDVEHVAKHILPSFVLGIGGIATGMLAAGLATEKTLDQLKDFSKEMLNLDRVAKQTGVSAGNVKEMMETFARSGIDAGAAQKNIAGLAASMADLTRVGSELRQKLVKEAGGVGQNAQDMIQWLYGLNTKDIDEFANEVKEKSENIYQNMFKHRQELGDSAQAAAARAAEARRTFLEAFGAPDIIQVMEKFSRMSAEEAEHWQHRIAVAKEFEKVSADIGQQWEKITAQWSTNLLEKFVPTLHAIDDLLKSINERGFLGGLKEQAEQTEERKRQLEEDRKAGKPVPPPEHRQKSWSDLFKFFAAPDKEHPPTPGFQHGGVMSRDGLAMLHAGETVIPGEGAETIEKQTKATDELTDQMKKLTDLLTFQVTAQMGGLGPGLGRGPGSIGIGGGGGGGAAGFGGGGFGSGGGYAAGAGSVSPMGNLPGLDTGAATRIGTGAGAAGSGIRTGTGTGTGTGRAGSWAPAGGEEALKANARGFVDKGALQGRLQELIKGSPLEGMKPEDAARFGIKTGSAAEWASLMSEMAGKESSYKTTEVGDIGHFGSGSRGLFQLSQQDAITYGLQKTPFTKEQLADPDFNSRMAVAIMAKRVAAGGIAGPKGAASYWGGYGKPGSYLARGDIRAADVSGKAPSAGDASQHLGDAFVGTGSANFMGSQRAREMGLVNPQIQEFDSGVPGIGKFKANQYAGPNIAGFLKDLHEAGAPLGAYAGAYVNKPGQHGMGNAVDIEHGLSDPQSKNGVYSGSPELSRWARDNPDKFSEIQERYHMFNLSAPGHYHHSGASGTTFASDWGHFEYSPARRKTAQELTADRANMDRQMAQKVEGSGKIDVNVNAPKGTSVNAEGGGLFKEVNVSRQSQMDRASSKAEGSLMDVD